MFDEPVMTAKAAAKRLGVGMELLQGLIDGGQVRGERQTGRTGGSVWVLPRAEVDRLRGILK